MEKMEMFDWAHCGDVVALYFERKRGINIQCVNCGSKLEIEPTDRQKRDFNSVLVSGAYAQQQCHGDGPLDMNLSNPFGGSIERTYPY